jgi:predicted acyl esterase
VVDRPEEDFPLARTHYTPLYLDAAGGTMSLEKPEVSSSTNYDPLDKASRAVFVHRFARDTELAGYMKLRLWVEAADADDLDIYTEVRKLDSDGRHLGSRTFLPPGTARTDLPEDPEAMPGMLVFSGATGMQRASMRHTDADRSGPAEPYHTFDRVEKLAKGEIVPVDIQIWPLGMRWRAEEQIQVVIGGQKLSGVEFPGLAGPDTINRGRHVIHTGGTYDSHLIIPVTN